jgi:RNase H-like domain found in reverse transcriptase/Integrase zinc binding domain
MKPPSTKKEVQVFMGLVNFYRDFCPDLAQTSIPLYELTHKKNAFEWNDKHQEAFHKIKQLITNAPLLKIPSLRKPFVIATDASAVALGAVLSQDYNGKEHPISFASRVLTEAEMNYSVVEKELLAIVFAIKKFRCYVYGNRFTVFCDHNPLQFIATMKDPTKRIARWLMWLQDYDFQVVYRPGKQNTNADCLSRCPVMAMTTAADCEEYEALRCGKDIASASAYYMERENIRLEANQLTLCRKGQKWKIPAPSERMRITSQIHSLGHFGISKTLKLVKQLFWWPKMYADIHQTVTQCQICQRRKPPNKNDFSKVEDVPLLATYPMEI